MRWSLRWHISVLLIVGLLLVTFVSATLGVAEAKEKVRDALVDQQQESGAAAANGVRYFLDSAQRSLSSSATQLSPSSLRPAVDAETVLRILDPLLAYAQEFSAAGLVDHTGRLAVARPEPARWTLPNFAGLAAFEAAREAARPALSLDPVSGPPYWVAPVVATRDDDRPYFLVGLLNVPALESVLSLNVQATTDATLVSAGGLVVATTAAGLAPDALQSWPALGDLDAGRALAVEAQSPDGGRDVLVTRTPLAGFPGQVVLMSSRDVIVALETQLIRNAFATSIGLATLAIVLGVFAAHRIARPLSQVRAATREMSNGRLAVRAEPHGARELQELAGDFNTMAAALERDRADLVLLQRHLEDLVRQRTAELEQKRQEMELFFFGVSHDFKGPLIAISSFAQLADEALASPGADRAELHDFVRRIRRSSDNLRSLTAALLQFAKAERVAPTYEAVDVRALARGVVEEARPQARSNGVALDVHLDAVAARTDPDRVRQILANLVDNAIKYRPQGRPGTVRVGLSLDRAGGFVLQVRDDGAGIPPEIQARLFQPFYRHVPHGVRTTGTGLGLSIVKRLVDSLHGRIVLASAVGRGSQFTVRLPSTPAAARGRAA